MHERDIAIPLGLLCVLEDDELTTCLRYSAAISPVLGLGLGQSTSGRFAVESTNPCVRFIVDVGDRVTVSDGPPSGPDVPCLRGEAVELVEALSMRSPLPESAPAAWRRMRDGLATAFDSPATS